MNFQERVEMRNTQLFDEADNKNTCRISIDK